MKLLPVLATAAVLVGCGGGPRARPPATPPAPAATPGATSATPLFYRHGTTHAYEFSRHDSLSYETMGGGTPQVTEKTGLLIVRSIGGRADVTLETIESGAGTSLGMSSLDSARGARWQIDLAPSGPAGALRGVLTGELVDQVGAAVRLLFPQLPSRGLTAQDVWSDSARYSLRVDAFDAIESAVRWSRATPANGGVRVEASERLVRSGSATQGGQRLSLSGTGERRITYDFAREGWVTGVTARDSLDLRVRVEGSGAIIPVRWRSALSARLRGAPPR